MHNLRTDLRKLRAVHVWDCQAPLKRLARSLLTFNGYIVNFFQRLSLLLEEEGGLKILKKKDTCFIATAQGSSLTIFTSLCEFSEHLSGFKIRLFTRPEHWQRPLGTVTTRVFWTGWFRKFCSLTKPQNIESQHTLLSLFRTRGRGGVVYGTWLLKSNCEVNLSALRNPKGANYCTGTDAF
jgi:hypothetical protein